jgi:probable HAF family extracellular repeat protein
MPRGSDGGLVGRHDDAGPRHAGKARSFAAAINAAEQVTGGSETTDRSTHAFLWDGTVLQDLTNLIHPADPLRLSVSRRELTLTTSDRFWPMGVTVELTNATRTCSHPPRMAWSNPAHSGCSDSASRVWELRDDAERPEGTRMGWVTFWVLCGIASSIICGNKGRSGFAWFLFGCLLGPLGRR